MPPWSLQNSQNWLIFSHVKKLPKMKKNKNCAGPPPPPELHIKIFSFSDSCTPVHWIMFYLQIHVLGYMEFRFFSLFLCVAQAVEEGRHFVFSSTPCTRVHGILIFLQIHVPRYMEFRFFFTILMCSSGGGGGPAQKKFFFWQFFSICEKINRFWEFCKDQGGKI